MAKVAAKKDALATTTKPSLSDLINAPAIKKQLTDVFKENSASFAASIIDLHNNDTNLQGCDPNAIIAEALKAASLKLPLSRGLGFGYILPYKKGDGYVPQFQMGYKGYIQLALRSGQYEYINADVVYEGQLSRSEKLRGLFEFEGEQTSNKITGYFCHIELKNGFSKTLYMTTEQIKAHAEKYSKSFGTSFSPWKSNFDEMALKTVLKKMLSHYGTLSVEMVSAFDTDISDEIDANANTVDIKHVEVDNGSKALKAEQIKTTEPIKTTATTVTPPATGSKPLF